VVGYRVPENGSNGQSATSVYNFPVYIRSATAPGTPVENTGSWNFATGSGVAPTGTPSSQIWATNPPLGTANLWVSYSTAIAVAQGIDTTLTWSVPNQLAQAGAAGTDGLSIYNYPVYQANSATPITPTGGSYNFGTRVGTPPAGWSNVVPATGNVWISTAQAQIQGTTGIWAGSNTWATPQRFNGAAGINGNTTVIPLVYAAKTTAPSGITTLGYYNFATNTLTPPTASDVTWYRSIQPGWSGLTVWSSQASFVSNNPTANVANTTSWTPPQISFSPGANGEPGTRGFVPLGFVVTAVNPLTMSAADLTAAFTSARTNVNPPIGLGYPPIAGDAAQFYWKNPTIGQADVTIVVQYNGTTWQAVYDKVLSGNVVATGSITAAQMKTNDLYTLTIQSTNANVGDYQSLGFWFDSSSGNARMAGNVSIGDSLRIGNNANIGNSIIIGTNAFIGDSLRIGNTVVIGNNAVLGNSIRIGATANIGDSLKIGNSALIGNNLIIGNSASVGNNLIIGQNCQIGGNLSVSGLINNGSLSPNALPTSAGITNAGGTYSQPSNWSYLNVPADPLYATAGYNINCGTVTTLSYTPKPTYFTGAAFPNRLITFVFDITYNDPNGRGPDVILYLNGKTFSGGAPSTSNFLWGAGPTSTYPNGSWYLQGRGLGLTGRSISNNSTLVVQIVDTSPLSRFYNGVNYYGVILDVRNSSGFGSLTFRNASMSYQEIQ
jgi:carbonic anhydrase/acetyltransferase-like protein (isoleucine patch superfamily)